MANSGPNTNGSQFFISLAPTQWLDGLYITNILYLEIKNNCLILGKHTIFGRVCKGIHTVQHIGMAETNNQDRPEDDIFIRKAKPLD